MSAASEPWEHDYTFRRFAELLWPLEYELARSFRKGHTAANRRMQRRYEGFETYKRLVGLKAELNDLVADLQGYAR